MTDDPEFFAWLDGELDDQKSDRMAARVAADPALLRLAEQHRSLQARLRGAFDPLAVAPLPERLIEAAKLSPVVDLAAERLRRRPSVMVQLSAMAASLVLGLLAGSTLFAGEGGPVREDASGLVASGDLEQALNIRLASSANSEGLRIALTFRDRSNSVCRTFEGIGAAGLACRNGGKWQIRGLFNSPEGQQGSYRMASGQDPRLLAMVEESIAGEPFGPEEEKSLVDSRWKK